MQYCTHSVLNIEKSTDFAFEINFTKNFVKLISRKKWPTVRYVLGDHRLKISFDNNKLGLHFIFHGSTSLSLIYRQRAALPKNMGHSRPQHN